MQQRKYSFKRSKSAEEVAPVSEEKKPLTVEEARAMLQPTPAPDQGLSPATPKAEVVATERMQTEEKVAGLSKFDSDNRADNRIILPRLKLVQSMSRDFTEEDIQPGNFRNSLTGEVLGDAIEIYVLGIFHWRRYFQDRQLSCLSNDNLTGTGDPGGECRLCPLSKWQVRRVNGVAEIVGNARTFRAKKDEQMVGPACSEQIVFPSIVLSSEWDIPAALVCQRSTLASGWRLYSLVKLGAPSNTIYRVVSGKTTNEKGTWYTPQITISRKLNPDDLAKYAHYRDEFKAEVVDVDEEDIDSDTQNE